MITAAQSAKLNTAVALKEAREKMMSIVSSISLSEYEARELIGIVEQTDGLFDRVLKK